MVRRNDGQRRFGENLMVKRFDDDVVLIVVLMLFLVFLVMMVEKRCRLGWCNIMFCGMG